MAKDSNKKDEQHIVSGNGKFSISNKKVPEVQVIGDHKRVRISYYSPCKECGGTCKGHTS